MIRHLSRRWALTDGARVQRFWTEAAAVAAAAKWNLRCAMQRDSTVWTAVRIGGAR